MFKVKETEPKTTTAKKNITISNIRIVDNKLVDDDGDIVSRLEDEVDGLADEFTIKLSLELPEDNE